MITIYINMAEIKQTRLYLMKLQRQIPKRKEDFLSFHKPHYKINSFHCTGYVSIL